MSDKVAVMYLGKVVESGPVDVVFSQPSHPYTVALVSAIPIADPRMRGKGTRVILTGEPPSPSNPPSGCRFRTRCPKASDICAQREPELRAQPNGVMAACHHPA